MDQAQALTFLNWIGHPQHQLTEYCHLYFGDAAIICSNIGRKYLRSAYRFVINTCNGGFCWRGSFTVLNFMVTGGQFMMGIPAPHRTRGFHDLVTDLGALSNALLPYYCEGNTPGNRPALFTDHLHYITTNIPRGIGPSIVFQSRFTTLIYYHFAFSLPDPMSVLFSALATAKSHLGHTDTINFNNLLQEAWDDLLMDQFPHVGLYWTDQGEQNPIFYEVMMHRSRRAGAPLRNGYVGTPQSLYGFGRNNKVHAPEKTLGPRGALPWQIEPVPPNGAGHWRWMITYPAGQWNWEWQPAQGQWIWPTVPGDMRWRMIKWPTAPALPPVPSSAQTTLDQKMDNPVNLDLMAGKEFGMFFAHATSLVLIFLQCDTPQYIEQPYDRYKESMGG